MIVFYSDSRICTYLDFYMLINRNTYIPRYYRDRGGTRTGVAGKRKEIQKNPYHATLLTSIVVFMQEPEGPSPAERKEPTTPTDPNCGFTPNLARYTSFFIVLQKQRLISYILYFQQLYFFSCKIFSYFKVYSYV